MFKPKKSFSQHKPDPHNSTHRNENESSRKYAGHGPYGHDHHGRKEYYSYKNSFHEQDFHETEACQRCPYKRGFYEHFQGEHNDERHHRHHHPEGGFHHSEGMRHGHDGEGQHHPHSEGSPQAMRFEDGSLQCLGCPNECIMTVTENGSVEGNHCPRGVEAARNIKEK